METACEEEEDVGILGEGLLRSDDSSPTTPDDPRLLLLLELLLAVCGMVNTRSAAT